MKLNSKMIDEDRPYWKPYTIDRNKFNLIENEADMKEFLENEIERYLTGNE